MASVIDTIKKLHKLNRALVSADIDKTIDLLAKEIPLKKITIPTGTKCFTWKIPQFWSVESATLTDLNSGKKILDIKDEPLYLFVGSLPFEGQVSFEELKKHLRHECYFDGNKNAVPYTYKYYNSDWGFSLSYNQFQKLDKKARYQVSIKTKYKKGLLTMGEVTIKGKTQTEIIIIAHTDHPYQANDNLSAVAVALELAKRLQKKDKLNHTIKILFNPETIGSIAYVWKRQRSLSKIKAVLALDVVGNNNRILVQKSFDNKHHLNYLAQSVLKNLGYKHEIAGYRQYIGSDELVFSDPKFKIPALMLSTWPFPQYHTNLDTPEIIDQKMLDKVLNLCLNLVENFDRNFIPIRTWTGPLMRGGIGWFLGKLLEDHQLELFGYLIDGKKSVLEIAQELEMDHELALNYGHSLLEKGLVKNPYIK